MLAETRHQNQICLKPKKDTELEYAQLLCMLHSRGMSMPLLLLSCAPWPVLPVMLRREKAGK